MVEAELIFADNSDLMSCVEEYVKYTLKYVLNNCWEDLDHLDKGRPGLIAWL